MTKTDSCVVVGDAEKSVFFFKIKVTEQEQRFLKNVTVMLATPTSGACHFSYVKSCMDLVGIFQKLSISVKYTFKVGNALLPLARNEIMDEFMAEGCTHLLMVDSDTGFDVEDILKLILFNKDVIGAPISKKSIDWHRVWAAIESKRTNNPEDSIYFGTEVNFVPFSEEDSQSSKGSCSIDIRQGEPLRVSSVGTGLVLIKREVLKKMEEEYPELKYFTLVRSAGGSFLKKEMFSFFELTRKKDGFMMAEDVSFCHRVNEMGMETWIYPWAKTSHWGDLEFKTDFGKQIK